MAIFRGLNTQVSLNDVDSKTEALKNLNLNKLDLDVIFGITDGDNAITNLDLRMISSLDIDYGKEAKALEEGSNTITAEIGDFTDITNELRLNVDLDGILSANAVKYDYFDFVSQTDKKADISTSRISSWSSSPDPSGGAGDIKIFYGGDIEVIGDTLDVDSLNIVEEPKRVRFDAELPTHVVTINVNGNPTQFLAMKGIPVVFEGMFFRSQYLYHRVGEIPVNPGAQPNWVSVRQPDGFEIVGGRMAKTGTDSTYRGYPSSGNVRIYDNLYRYRFSGFRTSSRNMEFYYNPDYIEAFGIPNTNTSVLPNQTIEGLKFLDISKNNFVGLPDIKRFAPNLETLLCNGNNLYREIGTDGLPVTANQQLQERLPSSLKTLMLHASFRDSEVIDLSGVDAPALEKFSFRSYFYNGRGYYGWASLRMTGSESDNPNNEGKAPILKTDNLTEYELYNQPYLFLDRDMIVNALNLRNIYIDWSGISGLKDSSGNISNITLTNSNNTIESIYFRGGRINLIDVRNSTSIRNYEISYQYDMNIGLEGVDTNNIFTATSGTDANLTNINCYYSYRVTGDIGTGIQSKYSLRSLNLYQTSVSGSFSNSSLEECVALDSLTLGGSRPNFDSDNWFGNSATDTSDGQVFSGAPNLIRLNINNSLGIRGSLPSLDYLTKLQYLNIYSTGLSGSIPSFSSNVELRDINMYSNSFTGGIPPMALPRCYRIQLRDNQLDGNIGKPIMDTLRDYYVNNNQLTGSIPDFSDCPRIRNINLSSNSLTGYTKGSFANLNYISQINLSNNNLTAGAAVDMINDLGILYNSNPKKRGVSLNLTANSSISEQQILGDESSTVRALVNLLRNANWQILMNP